MRLTSLPVLDKAISLEGFDGAGKSEARKNLVARGYSVFKTPPDSMSSQRAYFDAPERPLEERFDFYLSSVLRVSLDMLAEGKVAICDRHFLTTLAAHQAMGLPESMIEDKLFNSQLYLTAFTILLTVSEEERQKRLNERGRNENDNLNQKINKQLFEYLFIWAQRLNHEIIQIDTSDISPEEVVSRIESIILERIPV